MDKAHEVESQYLEYVNKCIEEELAYTIKKLEELKSQVITYEDAKRGEQFKKDAMIRLYSSRIDRLNQIKKSPYFGRMDFTAANTQNLQKLYIGKTTISDNENKLAVIDWRSPISSMYYDSNVGKSKYSAPMGIIEGYISLKRQIIIENAILQSILDTDLVTTDKILQSYLDVHADNKMKNIIASIQIEQNNIIRQLINKNIIVQGVAGSGKTSVALHRIAYLIYTLNNSNNKTKIDSQQFIVIGPNNYFLDYISGVLPDLDVDSVNQLTLSELATSIIDEKLTLIDQTSELREYYKNGTIGKESAIKNSQEFETGLELYLKELLSYYENTNIECYDKVIFSSEEISRHILAHKGNYRLIFANLEKNLIAKVKSNSEYYSELLTAELRAEAIKLPEDSEKRRLLFNKIELIQEELKTGLAKQIKKHFEPMTKKIISHYIDFINNLDRYMPNTDLTLFKQTTLKRLAKKCLSRDDIAPMLYLKSQLDQIKEYDKAIQVVVDEAQDLGLLEFKMLKKIFPNATFSIYGDLNQAIFSYRTVKNWDEVKESVFDNKCEVIYLNQSYRTTDEIMKEANKISDYLTGTVSNEVVRHGVDVKYLELDQYSLIESIKEVLQNYIRKGYQSIAIICKTEEEAQLINNKLIEQGIKIGNVNVNDNYYNGGICTISCGLSKGLEFDSTILVNVDSTNYNPKHEIDMKLLYVAMTRALHEMSVLTTGELPHVISKKSQEKKLKRNMGDFQNEKRY